MDNEVKQLVDELMAKLNERGQVFREEFVDQLGERICLWCGGDPDCWCTYSSPNYRDYDG